MGGAFDGRVADVVIEMLSVVAAVKHRFVRGAKLFAHHGWPVDLTMEKGVRFDLLRVSQTLLWIFL